MITKRDHEWALAQIGAIDDLIESAPEGSISRISLESQKEAMLAKAEANPPPHRWPAIADLRFEGDPVVANGIDAKFGAEAIISFGKIVSGLAASHNRELKAKGKLPGQPTKLIITGVTRGSFGFRIEEMPSDQEEYDTGEAPSMTQTFEKAVALLRGEDASQFDSRVQKSLFEFHKLIERKKANCRLDFGDHETTILGRKEVEEVKIKELRIRGRFVGFLPTSRTAEFFVPKSRETIRGKVSKDWHNADEINSVLLAKTIHAIVLRKAAKYTFLGYELLAQSSK